MRGCFKPFVLNNYLDRETALKGDFGKILQPIARIGMSWIAPEQIFDAEMPFPY